jgi:SAM-dependent methyltransferase
MDRTRFSYLAHREMEFCSPIGAARVERAIDLLAPSSGSVVVDFGAGKCSWLARIVRRFEGVRGVGVEPAKVFAEEARSRHAGLIREGRLEVVVQNAAEFLAGRSGLEAALCIGSTHAFGDYGKTLEALAGCVRPGGVIVVAEGYWKRPPSAEYLKVLGGDESEFTTHAGNIEGGISRGLTPLWCSTVSDDEWDEYEWGYSRGIETWVWEHPEDPDAKAMLARSRGWREGYVRWGRETLGFGLYVFRV